MFKNENADCINHQEMNRRFVITTMGYNMREKKIFIDN